MTENQFFQELETALTRLLQEERIDILQDIKEYFANGQADGKTDSEIAAELGAPEEYTPFYHNFISFDNNLLKNEHLDYWLTTKPSETLSLLNRTPMQEVMNREKQKSNFFFVGVRFGAFDSDAGVCRRF
ncbi:DUF1700 domain-containing protein [Planococcus sp. ISL-109]|uniref:DUF1700 domain-containing protein n=1 Tax=Planococcus sp. ISL-109 TaxID=2819166 RepID=UPI001BE67AB4|nr:DUF1700 domain-containing protein [Planococcus sp. ISL-109]MBT2582836.1 DUF1700 domain-containing protein [Planococcus sp. ISL-109]